MNFKILLFLPKWNLLNGNIPSNVKELENQFFLNFKTNKYLKKNTQKKEKRFSQRTIAFLTITMCIFYMLKTRRLCQHSFTSSSKECLLLLFLQIVNTFSVSLSLNFWKLHKSLLPKENVQKKIAKTFANYETSLNIYLYFGL